MRIYINTNDASMDAGDNTDLIYRLKEKDIECYDHGEKRLSEVEKECVVYLINLKMFNDSTVNLRSGGEIGLSKWFKMLIITIINPANGKLKNELNKIDAHIFSEEDVVIINQILGDSTISDLIKSVESAIQGEEHVERRNKLRENFNNLIKKRINQIYKDIIKSGLRRNKLKEGY